ncbi:MAG TPA: hypothetical protein VLQ93_08300, partial [Myxococcaceae bacterium]|nr:hypothetical protein [Myxococcaceae bacterium]
MSEAAYEFGVVCEARADRDTACGLADRVLREAVSWLEPETLESCRKWRGSESEQPLQKWTEVKAALARKGVKGIFGHFGGRPGQPDAYMARLALLLMADASPPPDAVLLIRDSDGDPRRREGLEQARDDRHWPFPVIIGLAEPKRECWVLVGFDARNEDEMARLEALRQRLSFHPVQDAHRLDASEHGAKKDAKRALEELTQGDKERERACLEETPLPVLEARGKDTGLEAFLKEIRERLVPL